MDIKVFAVSLIFVLLSTYFNFILIEVMINRNVEITADVYHEQTKGVLSNYIQKMKTCAEKMAANPRIVTILSNSRTRAELSDEEMVELIDELHIYESALDGITFTEGIEVVSIPGKYIYTVQGVIRNYDLVNRPWFLEEYLDGSQASHVSDIHLGQRTEREQMNIIAPVLSEDGSEVVGAVMINIFLSDIMQYVSESFSYGTVKAYLYDDIETVYGEEGTLERSTYEKLLDNSAYYPVFCSSSAFQNNTKLLFLFETESLRQNEQNSYLRHTMRMVVIILELVAGTLLFICIRISYKPLMRVVNRLKRLLQDLDDTVNLTNGNKNKTAVEQLESISSCLEQSFDRKIKNMLYTDALTNMPNRMKLRAECERLLEQHEPFGVIFADLNKFKQVNDTYGHDVGDLLLKKFSQLLSEGLGDAGRLFRFAGDEFVILYTSYESKEATIQYFEEHIRPKFEETVYLNDEVQLKISFSSGLAVYPEHGTTYDELLQRSDAMMYFNKQGEGGNHLYICE
jgi:diguanylate cyclase (GGDEF)-like protein